MNPPFVRSAFNYDMHAASEACGTVNEEPSLTRQADALDANINTIVKRFGLTGQIPQVQVPPTYDDFGAVFDFQSAANVIRAAQESFNQLDAEVRARFNNDPGRYVDFCQNPDNIPEMRKMGLALPEPPAIIPPPPVKVEVVNSTPPK